MALTHLSRAGREALKVKLDLEAAILSCYRNYDPLVDDPRVTTKLLSRFRNIVTRHQDKFHVPSIIHGYLFDAWSKRKCLDEFLTLNATWPINTKSYLLIVEGMDLQDEFLYCLLTVADQEKLRLVRLTLESSQLSSKILTDLFIWTADFILSKDGGENSEPKKDDGPKAFITLWGKLVDEQESCRVLFRTCLKRILMNLYVKMVKNGVKSGIKTERESVSTQPLYTNGQGGEERGRGRGRVIDPLFVELLNHVVPKVIDFENHLRETIQELEQEFERWDFFIPGFSNLLRRPNNSSGSLKRRHVENQSNGLLAQKLQKRLQEDILSKRKFDVDHAKVSENDHDSIKLDGHQRAFTKICETIRQHQDLPENTLNYITRLLEIPTLDYNEIEAFKGNISWVESTIQTQSAGWRSCVKLKVQFFALFDESSINEEFADQICDCSLHWELCDVLCRYLQRYRVDPKRLTFECFQLGCELLLSVFSKRERIQDQIRDHLYLASRSICKDGRAPLFGSWDFWRINIEAQLTATLNQLVSTNSSTNSFAIPSHIIESLTKISLLAPYQVLAKIIGNAVVNRGQSDILLHVLVNLGQLPWLRPSKTDMTLLVNAIDDVVRAEQRLGETIADLRIQHSNLSEFILKAFKKTSGINQILLDPTEFLCQCVNPLLRSIVQGKGTKSLSFSSVSTILLKLYQLDFDAPGIEKNWLSNKIHEKILAQLLQLRTSKSTWTVHMILDESGFISNSKDLSKRELNHPTEQLEEISKVCELLVTRLTEFVESEETENDLEFNPVATGSVDLESLLIATPLYIACRQRLNQNIHLPILPSELSPLCLNHLKVFSIKNTKSSVGGSSREDSLVVALLIALDVSRMSDDVIIDVTQAISQNKGFKDSDKLFLSQALIPAVYRILSISSRSEGHRLLVQGIPSLARQWRVITEIDLFWDDIYDSLQNLLGRSWDIYTMYQYQTSNTGQEAPINPWNGFSPEEVVLTILNISEPLLRFALEPLTKKNFKVATQVYSKTVGFDVTVDYIGSLLLSSIKFTNIDWSSVLLDYLLYGFVVFCRLSSIVANEHQNRYFKNRFTLPPASSLSTLKPRSQKKKWTEEYYSFMKTETSNQLGLQEQMARSKARDEFILAAMNLSEEIARRQDLYYKIKKNNGLNKKKSKYALAEDVILATVTDSSMDPRVALRKAGKRVTRGNNRARQERGSVTGLGDSTTSSHELYQDDDSVPSENLHSSGMDDSTKAWFSGIMNTSVDSNSNLPTISHQGEVRDQQALVASIAPATPQSEKDTMSESEKDIAQSRVTEEMEMMTYEQIKCLNLALGYLPSQEEQAIRSRLTQALKGSSKE